MSIVKRAALALATTAALTTGVQAGGFSRGSANLDGLYISSFGDDPIIGAAGVTYVAPGRSYDRIDGVRTGFTPTGVPNPPLAPTPVAFSQNDVEFGESFAVPFASVGVRVSDAASCVGSYSQPYGADSELSGEVTFFQKKQSIDTFELGATCSYGFNFGRGTAYAIGGVFHEDLRYQQSRTFGQDAFSEAVFGVGDSRIDVTSDAVGFRIGAAYEIPEIALKAQLMYRSETTHNVSGSFSNTPFAVIFSGRAQALADAAGAAAAAGDLALAQQLQQQAAEQLAFANAAGAAREAGAFGTATLPRQVELNVQSGIAAGTLVFGSIKWTDWSVVQQIDLADTISGEAFTDFQGFFRDGWTVTAGVGRRFTEELAGSLALTWDRGVGTGYDTFSDTWTLAGGFAYDVNEIATVRAGGALIYFTDGEKRFGDFTATSPDEFGGAISSSVSFKF